MIQLIAFLYPVITGILSGIVPLRDKKNHRLVCGLIMILTDLLGILAMIRAERVEILHFSEKAVLSFALDDLGRFALAAVLILFTAVCFYSFTYMEHEKRTPMFFTFFFIAFTSKHSSITLRSWTDHISAHRRSDANPFGSFII